LIIQNRIPKKINKIKPKIIRFPWFSIRGFAQNWVARSETGWYSVDVIANPKIPNINSTKPIKDKMRNIFFTTHLQRYENQ
jgi:hypothetical protein